MKSAVNNFDELWPGKPQGTHWASLGVICEHMGLSVVLILMLEPKYTIKLSWGAMGDFWNQWHGLEPCQECDEENMRVRD